MASQMIPADAVFFADGDANMLAFLSRCGVGGCVGQEELARGAVEAVKASGTSGVFLPTRDTDAIAATLDIATVFAGYTVRPDMRLYAPCAGETGKTWDASHTDWWAMRYERSFAEEEAAIEQSRYVSYKRRTCSPVPEEVVVEMLVRMAPCDFEEDRDDREQEDDDISSGSVKATATLVRRISNTPSVHDDCDT